MSDGIPTVEAFVEASGLIQYWMREIGGRFHCVGADTLEELLPGDANLIINGVQGCTDLIVAAEGVSAPVAEYRLFANVITDIECTAHDIAWKTFEMMLSAVRMHWESRESWQTFVTMVFGGLEPDEDEFRRLIARLERERILVANYQGIEMPAGESRKRLTKPERLTRDQRIREDVRFNGLSQKDAAAKYRLHPGTISNILGNEP